MDRNIYIEKLLSHRLRGFGSLEHSEESFQKACLSSVPYLEVDTRVCADGGIYLYHNPKFRTETGSNYFFRKTDSSEINRIRLQNGEQLLSLGTALKSFKDLAKKHTKLCIDIKDCGFEKIYLEQITRYDLENQIYFISWIPQTLIRFAGLGTKIPLFLSHWNLFHLGSIGCVIERFSRDRIFRLSNYVIIGAKMVTVHLGAFAHGFQHMLLSRSLSEPLLKTLRDSGGGICIHLSMICRQLIDYCNKNMLKLWVFSANNARQYQKYANNPFVDVIFSDKAQNIIKTLSNCDLRLNNNHYFPKR